MTNQKSQKSVAIAIVTWNSAREIGECLAPLQELPANWQVWVADNASSDATVQIIEDRFPKVNLIANRENLGFAEACNQIVAKTSTDYVLFLNPDAVAGKTALENSLDEIETDPQIGVLGVRLKNENGVLHKTCFRFPTVFNSTLEKLGLYRLLPVKQKREFLLGDFFDHAASRETDWVCGAFMLSPRAALDEIGGIPEDYFLFAEDLDYCYRVKKAGYRVRFFAGAEIVHKSNKSAGQLPSEWRVERTVLSKYAFCFTQFGALRTRLIQFIDFTGYCLEASIVRLRRTDSPFLAESKIYRKFIRKAMKMSRKEIFRLLHSRP